MLRRATLRGAGVLGTASACAAYVYRPQPWSKPPRDVLSERSDEDEGILMKSARMMTFIAGTAAFSFLMHVLNSFEVKRDEHYAALVERVGARPKGVPLLTVSNHASPVDDPGVLVAMLPAYMAVQPQLMRWTICAEEICFKYQAGAAMFGSAKVLPIARGEGIDQRKLLNFYRRLLSGAWCHIFPEGHCEQDGALGGREPGPPREELGRLKWGVGKLIAHSAVPPVVIPIFHTGMAHVVPINPLTRKILHAMPRVGKKVTARVGRAIDFGDLLEEHVRQHGHLRKFGISPSSPREETDGGIVIPRGEAGDVIWRSTAEERVLYNKIARRIEEALLELEAAARRDLGGKYPGEPAERAAILSEPGRIGR